LPGGLESSTASVRTQQVGRGRPPSPPLGRTLQTQIQTGLESVEPTQTSLPATSPPLVRFSFGRQSVQSSNREVPDDEEPHQRMMTQRARVQIRNYLPTAENEGDAIEKLRAKVESFQNRNRARG